MSFHLASSFSFALIEAEAGKTGDEKGGKKKVQTSHALKTTHDGMYRGDMGVPSGANVT